MPGEGNSKDVKNDPKKDNSVRPGGTSPPNNVDEDDLMIENLLQSAKSDKGEAASSPPASTPAAQSQSSAVKTPQNQTQTNGRSQPAAEALEKQRAAAMAVKNKEQVTAQAAPAKSNGQQPAKQAAPASNGKSAATGTGTGNVNNGKNGGNGGNGGNGSDRNNGGNGKMTGTPPITLEETLQAFKQQSEANARKAKKQSLEDGYAKSSFEELQKEMATISKNADDFVGNFKSFKEQIAGYYDYRFLGSSMANKAIGTGKCKTEIVNKICSEQKTFKASESDVKSKESLVRALKGEETVPKPTGIKSIVEVGAERDKAKAEYEKARDAVKTIQAIFKKLEDKKKEVTGREQNREYAPAYYLLGPDDDWKKTNKNCSNDLCAADTAGFCEYQDFLDEYSGFVGDDLNCIAPPDPKDSLCEKDQDGKDVDTVSDDAARKEFTAFVTAKYDVYRKANEAYNKVDLDLQMAEYDLGISQTKFDELKTSFKPNLFDSLNKILTEKNKEEKQENAPASS
jgi:hypothetical protein